jgi:hypothetical protein
MLFLLIAGHALGDYPLQPDAMATCKCRKAHLPLQNEVPWYYWMAAHVLTHGLVTAFIVAFWTHDNDLAVKVGMLEAGVHWIIDTLKCEGVFGIHVDQALHVLCKVTWWLLIAHGVLT